MYCSCCEDYVYDREYDEAITVSDFAKNSKLKTPVTTRNSCYSRQQQCQSVGKNKQPSNHILLQGAMAAAGKGVNGNRDATPLPKSLENGQETAESDLKCRSSEGQPTSLMR